MAITRKRERQLKRLRKSANKVIAEQRVVLDHANEVARTARGQLAQLTREQVGPTVRDVVDHRIRPAVASGVATAESTVSSAKKTYDKSIAPAFAGAVGSVVGALELKKHPQLAKALSKASGGRIKAPRTGPGVGGYLLIGLGVAAVATVAYAAWQTLRADDDLWITDDSDDQD